MTIVVGSPVPGLLGALEQALGGAQEVLIISDAAHLQRVLRSPATAVTALLLRDTLTPLPNQDVAQTLWAIVAFLSRQRHPLVPVLLTLDPATPTVIQDALRAEVQRTGGEVALLAHRVRTPDHPAAQQAVAWILAQLQVTPPPRQRVIVPAAVAGGARMSTSMLNLGLYLRSRGLRVLMVVGDPAQGMLL
ncbi:MAG: hypothetical protein EOM10_11135, partial [Opitutae bacterium]|nr:hypothetical protein [Opitutae bacterium]